MYLIIKIDHDGIAYDRLYDTKETALLDLQRLGEHEKDFGVAWSLNTDEAWDDYHRMYQLSRIHYFYIDPVRDLITLNTIFDREL